MLYYLYQSKDLKKKGIKNMKVIEIEGFKELETTFLKEFKKRSFETKPKRKRKASPIKKLVLSTEESKELIQTGWIEINRNGFTLTLEKNNDFDSSQEESKTNPRYWIMIINDYDKVIVKDVEE